MKIFKAICFGVVLWSAGFVMTTILTIGGFYDNAVVNIAAALLTGFIALAMIVYLKPKNIGVSLTFGIIWVASGMFFDLIVTWRFYQKIFFDWSLWASYTLILTAVVFGFYLIENNNDEQKDKRPPEPPSDIRF